MQFAFVVAPAEISVNSSQLRRRLQAPALIVDALCGEVNRERSILAAILDRTIEAAERAAKRFAFEALVGEAVLHLNVDRAAERVETEDRIVGQDVSSRDCVCRNKVPVDRVPEGFIKTDAAHVNRETLRGALQW